VIYKTLRRKGIRLDESEAQAVVYPEQLARFRRWGGPSGHVESQYALADTSTGSSGHGFSSGLGFAVLHRGCGLSTILTGKAEKVYGIVTPENTRGRGIRFGIAEQNMSGMGCAMAQDTLPGGFRPMTAFATYGVFGPLMSTRCA
jgi:transketolase